MAYATNAKLLFSGSIDGSIGVSTDKGNLLQVMVAEQQSLGNVTAASVQYCNSTCQVSVLLVPRAS